MGMRVGASQGFSAPVAKPVSPPPAPTKRESGAAVAERLMLSTEGSRGTKVNAKA